MTDSIISCHNLTKTYGIKTAINDVSFDIRRGSITALIGKNGAGKTTLIRLLTGLAFANKGNFEINTQQTRTSTSVASIVESPSIYKDMSAMDNLIAQSKLLGLEPDEDYIAKTLALVGLDSSSKVRAKNYSLGMQQRLAIALTIVGRPELLILDEPTNGLDPQGIHDMRELFININKKLGTTIVISSHILSELSKFATDYLFIDNGKLLKSISADELQNSLQKKLRISVNDEEKAIEVLAPLGKATIVGKGIVDLFGDVAPTTALLALAQNDIVASGIVSIADDLESYYIDLLGGAQ